MWADGLDRDIPFVVTEYGYSPFATSAEDDLEGAIVNLDGVGMILSMGGDAAYLYGYEPDEVEKETPCTSGNNMILLMMPDDSLKKTSTFYAAEMMTSEWLMRSGGKHELLSTNSDSPTVGAYAVNRPDGRISILLLNRDPERSTAVTLKADGAVQMYDASQFSHSQYTWNSMLGRPAKDDPPVHFVADASRPVELPPYSITVLRQR
ncbi:MAG: hypothetical protein JO314_14110 [Acidobacteria bacterium]|nr:hypothetical protein [Acidobacteriota bacterium]